MKLRPYKKNLDYSYTLGVHPTRVLLEISDIEIVQILINSQFEKLDDVKSLVKIAKSRGVMTTVSDKAIHRLAPKENTAVIGVFKKFERALDEERSHIALVNVRNSGNLGTITRTMLAFGVKDVAIIRPAVDIFHPSVIAASVGASLKVNFEYFEFFVEYQRKYENHSIYTFFKEANTPLQNVKFNEPFTLVFGNENQGLPENIRNIGTGVSIPQTDEVESLNLAMSVGVALWEAGRK